MLSRKKIWQKTRTTRCPSSSSSRGDDQDHYDGDASSSSCSIPSTPRSSPRSPSSSSSLSHWVLESEADNTTSASASYGDYNSDDSESEYSTSPSKTNSKNGLTFTSLFTNLPEYNTRPSLKGLQADGVIIDMSELPPPSERRHQYNNKNNNNKSSSSNIKRVKFCLGVKVILIPTRDEFRRLGLFDELFWTHTDFVQFKQEAFNELQSFILTNEYKIKKKAMKRLGVLKNFVDSDDILKYDSLNSQRRRALLFPPTSSKHHRFSKQKKGSIDNFFKDVNDDDDEDNREFVVDDESLRTNFSHSYNSNNNNNDDDDGDYDMSNNHNSNLSNDGVMRVSSCNQLKEASVILYQPNEYFETLANYKEEEEEDGEGGGISGESIKSSGVCPSNLNTCLTTTNTTSSSSRSIVTPSSSTVAAVDGDEDGLPGDDGTSGGSAAEFGLDHHVWHSVEKLNSLSLNTCATTGTFDSVNLTNDATPSSNTITTTTTTSVTNGDQDA